MKVIGYWLLVIGCVFSAHAELSVTLRPEVESRFIYEPFSLMLTVNAKADTPDIPETGGFRVLGVTPLASTETNSNFRIDIIPEQAGILTVPPFNIQSGEQQAQTAPLRLAVSAPRRADEMELSVQFSATNLYVDQPIRMSVTWDSKVPFTYCDELQLELPLLNSPDWETYPLDPGVPEKERIGLPVNNQRVIASTGTTNDINRLIFSFMLVPRKDGLSHPAPARMNCALMQDRHASSQYPSYFDNHFFNRPAREDRFERIYLSASFPDLLVQALPESGRTARYCGIAGPCTAEASVRPAETVVGQPMLFSIDLTNLTFGAEIKALPDVVLEGVGPEFKITLRPMNERSTESTRSFIYVLRPLRSGATTIPALALQIFDPEQKTYRTVRTEPLSIQVDPDGKQTVYQPQTTEEQQPKVPLSGIQANRKESRLTMNTYRIIDFVAHNAWAFWLLPPLLWLALRPWLRRRDRCRTDPAYARAAHAARRFRRAAKHNEETAWKNYLADRFDLNAEAVTYETVACEFEKRNIDGQLLQTIHDCFEHQDIARYSLKKPDRKSCSAVRELVRRIEKTVPFLLLALCLLSNARAAEPEQLFEQAMQIRTDKPDEAAPLFTEAALGFEVHQQFFNAGNSWFFAGENGRALANYLFEESRNPFSRQIRESISFIRTQRADSFQTLEKPMAKISRVWKQFGRWAPSIRFGLLTIIYLAAWIMFLTTRFIGRTVPRRIWITLSLLALIPASSLVWSFFQPSEGVIIAPAEARLGPGYAYDKAFETILHEATEFQWLEKRDSWVHIRLPDKTEAWLTKSACVKVR